MSVLGAERIYVNVQYGSGKANKYGFCIPDGSFDCTAICSRYDRKSVNVLYGSGEPNIYGSDHPVIANGRVKAWEKL